MCVIIASPNGIKPDKDIVTRCFEDNPDGAGLAWIRGRRIQVFRTFELKAFQTKLEAIPAGTPFIAHCRIATHGGINYRNIHPFFINQDVVMAHNGILNNVPIRDRRRSDTWHFAQLMTRSFEQDKGFLRNQAHLKNLEKVIGHGNKLAFLHVRDGIVIANKQAGTEHGGCWYSNEWSLYEFSFTSYTSKGKYFDRYYRCDRWEVEIDLDYGECEFCGHTRHLELIESLDSRLCRDCQNYMFSGEVSK